MKHKNLSSQFNFNPWGIQSKIFDVELNSTGCDNIIGIDCGGTKTLISYVDEAVMRRGVRSISGFADIHERVACENSHYKSLIKIIQLFLENYKIDPVKTAVCIAGAGPVVKNKIQMSNQPWLIDADEIQNQFQFKYVYLLNDLEAMIYAVDAVDKNHLITLNPGKKDMHGNVAVIAAGTGLGESIGFYSHDLNSRVGIATEGGNSDFAPVDDLEIELLRFLRPRKGHVSWEDLVSGNGILNIYEFLSNQHGQDPAQDRRESSHNDVNNSAQAIATRALAENDPVCKKTLDMFINIYAAESGNLALKCLPYGGLFLAGGIAAKNITLFENGKFMKRFVEKGNLKSLLQNIPVYLINNPEYGVLGAINYALLQMKKRELL